MYYMNANREREYQEHIDFKEHKGAYELINIGNKN